MTKKIAVECSKCDYRGYHKTVEEKCPQCRSELEPRVCENCGTPIESDILCGQCSLEDEG